jgi:hypothetical protein
MDFTKTYKIPSQITHALLLRVQEAQKWCNYMLGNRGFSKDFGFLLEVIRTQTICECETRKSIKRVKSEIYSIAMRGNPYCETFSDEYKDSKTIIVI